jgi:hypothetical protein
MNLHGIVSGAIGGINPQTPVTVQQSTGFTIGADGSQIPSYTTIATTAQVQALSWRDMLKLEGLNAQGVQQKAYLNGNFEGIFRVLGKGGDLIVINGITYLVTAVLERWPDWCCVAITAQTDTV